jgi:predicted dehydrogenase
MQVVVIGLGSMGKRRIRLIQKLNNQIKILGVDTNEERRAFCASEYGIDSFASLAQAVAATPVDCAFVCTSPLSHHGIIEQCLKFGLHTFTELNLVSDGYDTNIALAANQNLVLFMSSTFLYRDEIKRIKTYVNSVAGNLNYTYHVGQYLPDWHPWENYKDFFVGDKRSNGCREIFAIELPWLTAVFGKITKVDVVKSKISALHIDYNDNYLAIIQHESGHKGTLAVDVVSRKAVRNLEVFGEELYLHWNGTPTGLSTYDFDTRQTIDIKLYDEIDQLDNYSSFVVENAYTNEIMAFFDAVANGSTPLYSFEKDQEILEIIDRIEA